MFFFETSIEYYSPSRYNSEKPFQIIELDNFIRRSITKLQNKEILKLLEIAEESKQIIANLENKRDKLIDIRKRDEFKKINEEENKKISIAAEEEKNDGYVHQFYSDKGWTFNEKYNTTEKPKIIDELDPPKIIRVDIKNKTFDSEKNLLKLTFEMEVETLERFSDSFLVCFSTASNFIFVRDENGQRLNSLGSNFEYRFLWEEFENNICEFSIYLKQDNNVPITDNKLRLRCKSRLKSRGKSLEFLETIEIELFNENDLSFKLNIIDRGKKLESLILFNNMSNFKISLFGDLRMFRKNGNKLYKESLNNKFINARSSTVL